MCQNTDVTNLQKQLDDAETIVNKSRYDDDIANAEGKIPQLKMDILYQKQVAKIS